MRLERETTMIFMMLVTILMMVAIVTMMLVMILMMVAITCILIKTWLRGVCGAYRREGRGRGDSEK